ncbi:hypothetical protein Tco_1332509 [Tanacetum coccineum]
MGCWWVEGQSQKTSPPPYANPRLKWGEGGTCDETIFSNLGLKNTTVGDRAIKAAFRTGVHNRDRDTLVGPRPVTATQVKPTNKYGVVPASSKRTKTRNHEPEPQATVEARVAPEQSDVTKKHPRHRIGCQCIICIQPPSGSKHSPTCSCRACVAKRLRVKNMTEKASQKPPIRRKRKVPEPAELSNQQIIRVDHGSEENEVERREPSPSTEPSNQQTITVRSGSEEN